MAYNPHKKLKLYYSIKEVAELFEVSESSLRFWEKEFPMLQPKKASRGVRQYTEDDLEQVRLVYHLIKEKGMTIQGARNALKQNPQQVENKVEVIERLKAIRQELLDMKKELDQL